MIKPTNDYVMIHEQENTNEETSTGGIYLGKTEDNDLFTGLVIASGENLQHISPDNTIIFKSGRKYGEYLFVHIDDILGITT